MDCFWHHWASCRDGDYVLRPTAIGIASIELFTIVDMTIPVYEAANYCCRSFAGQGLASLLYDTIHQLRLRSRMQHAQEGRYGATGLGQNLSRVRNVEQCVEIAGCAT